MSHVCARPRAGRGPAGDSRGGRRRRRGRGPGPALARGRFGARTRGFHTHRCGSRSETLVSRGPVRRFLRRHRASRELGPRPACVDFPRAGSSVQNAVASRLTSVARTRTRRNESLAAFTTASPPLPLLRPQPPVSLPVTAPTCSVTGIRATRRPSPSPCTTVAVTHGKSGTLCARPWMDVSPVFAGA